MKLIFKNKNTRNGVKMFLFKFVLCICVLTSFLVFSYSTKATISVTSTSGGYIVDVYDSDYIYNLTSEIQNYLSSQGYTFMKVKGDNVIFENASLRFGKTSQTKNIVIKEKDKHYYFYAKNDLFDTIFLQARGNTVSKYTTNITFENMSIFFDYHDEYSQTSIIRNINNMSEYTFNNSYISTTKDNRISSANIKTNLYLNHCILNRIGVSSIILYANDVTFSNVKNIYTVYAIETKNLKDVSFYNCKYPLVFFSPSMNFKNATFYNCDYVITLLNTMSKNTMTNCYSDYFNINRIGSGNGYVELCYDFRVKVYNSSLSHLSDVKVSIYDKNNNLMSEGYTDINGDYSTVLKMKNFTMTYEKTYYPLTVKFEKDNYYTENIILYNLQTYNLIVTLNEKQEKVSTFSIYTIALMLAVVFKTFFKRV